MSGAGRRARLVVREHCPSCCRRGVLVHVGIVDRLFAAEGAWGFRRCGGCGLTWLSPAPVPEDLPLLYEGYYTHEVPASSASPGGRDRLRMMILGALGRRVNVPLNARDRMIGTLLSRLSPLREAAVMSCLELADLEPGRVLDVGCGNGEWLLRMAGLGWSLYGVEPDPKAAAAAAGRGVKIVGPTIEACAERNFDAVVLSHVLEHVPDAPGLLRECVAHLRPGGRLVVVTPNVEGWGYRRFRRCWRGLEPPRHLTLYSLRALEALALQAGLRILRLRSSARAALTLWRDSLALEAGRSRKRSPEATLQGGIAQILEHLAIALGLPAGEELVLVAER